MNPANRKPPKGWHRKIILAVICTFATTAHAKPWAMVDTPTSFDAEYRGIRDGQVILQGNKGATRTFPITRFRPEDQVRVFELELSNGKPFPFPPQTALNTAKAYDVRETDSLGAGRTTLSGKRSLRVKQPLTTSDGTVNFTSPDAWLFLEATPASEVLEKWSGRLLVHGSPAAPDDNIRVVQHGTGSVVIPHGVDFPAMTVFLEENFRGPSLPVRCHASESALDGLKIGSFRLKRGYMATLARNPDGTGVSRNYVAQDHDLEIASLPEGLADGVAFLRIFPWRWTNKKGVAGAIWQDLNVGWFYNWNLNTQSSPDIEYVPIRQNRSWPGLEQDWRARGSLHLLGFNEPDKSDQAKMTVDEAIRAWPLLLRTGLRLGSPAPSDGGLAWLYEFMEKADAADLRVDFVAVHYYRAHPDPGDAKGAARQMRDFLKGVHDRVKRPLWVTEWNNGANWTKAPKPNERQQRDAIREMIEMLDDTPYVERYAIYNWVEDVRHVKRKDGTLTPAGEAYRDQKSPTAYRQAKP